MFESSATTEKLDAALAKAQGKIKKAEMNRENSAFKVGNRISKYADLESVWDACRGALSESQISVTQWPLHSTDDRLHLMTRIAHAGEWMRAEFSIPLERKTAHGYGAAITYLKRYALAAVVGVVDSEDDDGNAASGLADAEPAKSPGAPTKKLPTPKPQAPDGRQKRVLDALKESAWKPEDVTAYLGQAYQAEKVAKLTQAEFDDLLQAIQTQSPKDAFESLKDMFANFDQDRVL